MDEVRLGSRLLQLRRQLLAGGERVPLGKRALDIVSVLAEANGQIVTKDELLESVWPGVNIEENALQVHIVALRKALGPDAERLKTIRGVGYQLEIENGTFGRPGAERALPRSPTPLQAAPHPPPQAPTSSTTASRSASAASITKTRARLIVLALAALLLLSGGAWALFDFGLGFGMHQRIPVVVRQFAPSGNGERTESALASGITDEMITRLRRVPDLRVATAAPDGSVPGHVFKDAYIVGGNIRSSGDRVRVTARLAKANGEILWTDTFDRKVGELFQLQELIAANIADALSVSLDVGSDSVAYGGTSNPEAYAAFLQFRANQYSFDQSVPLGYLQRAITLDPNYLKAQAALADSYSPRLAYASSKQEADRLLHEMDLSSTRMLSANPNIWISHLSRALYFFSREDFAAAKREMDRASKLDTGKDPALQWGLATLDYGLGYRSKASALVRSAAIIDPISGDDPQMIRELLYNGRYQEAIDQFDKLAREGNVGRMNHALEVFWAYMLMGREAEAVAFAGRQGFAFGKVAQAIKGDDALAAMTMPQLREWVAKQYGEGRQFQLAFVADLASYYGRPELAVNLMRLTLERPGEVGSLSMWHPAFARARRTSAFDRLVADLGLVKMWHESGDWGDFCKPVGASSISCT